jgi:hypothetical protein
MWASFAVIFLAMVSYALERLSMELTSLLVIVTLYVVVSR